MHFEQIRFTDALTFMTKTFLLEPIDDPPAVQVVGRKLDQDLVSRQDPDEMLTHLAGNVRQDLVTVFEHFHPKETESAPVIAPMFFCRFDSEKFAVVVPEKGYGRQNIKIGPISAIVEKIVRMSGKNGFNMVFLGEVEQPGTRRLIDIVVMPFFMGLGDKERIVAK